MSLPNIEVYPDADALAQAAAERITTIAENSVARHNVCSIALSGGSTPRRLHRIWAALSMPWNATHFFFGDERSVPPEDDQSNYRMARETLFDAVNPPLENVHRIRAENGAQAAAESYEEELREFFSGQGLMVEEWPRFDVILLGMGDDGHTASLFPGTPAIQEQSRWVVANPVEKLETDRITLTYPVLNHAATVLLLVTGVAKAERLSEILHTQRHEIAYPVQNVQPIDGDLVWMLDSAAASKLPDDHLS